MTLNFNIGAVALTRTSYGQVPDTSAAVEYVRCDGTEERLIDCTIRGAPVSSSQCTHSGVRCGRFQQPDITLGLYHVF